MFPPNNEQPMATTHGLHYPEHFLEGLEVIQNRPAPHTPIYALSAAQYAQLKHEYSLADVDDSVLFPFLHGLEGDNVAQNLFFSHSRGRDGQPTHATVPRYRGLMSVACPIEDEEGRVVIGLDTESGSSSGSDIDQLAYEDGDHQHPVPLSTSYNRDSTFAQSDWTLTRQHSSSFSSASATSSSPLSASTTATSLWSDSQHGLQGASGATCADEPDSESPPPRSSSTCRLLSSVLPHEIISSTDATFVKPIIPDGISLRNFGTQVPIYSTLSDIVLYSPNGATRGVCDLAERIKEAIEVKAFERNGHQALERSATEDSFANGILAYNVFVVTDSFDVFERDFPELIAVDGRGKPVQQIDFMAREKEEMRQLTQATLIHQNIWLGNTADVPIVPRASLLNDVDPFDTAENAQAGGWDICIECRDDAYFPTPAHLRHAEDHIAKLDAVWAAHCTPVSSVSSYPFNGSVNGNGNGSNGSGDSPRSDNGTPPMSPTLAGLSNLRVNTGSPKPIFRPSPVHAVANERDTTMRSRSSSPGPGATGADGRPIIQRGGSSTHLRTRSPTPQNSSCSTSASSSSASSPPSSTSLIQHSTPPRPAPNPRSIVHLSFPSSPPSNPHTTAQLLNILAFLSRYADPQGWAAGAYNVAHNTASSKRRGSLSSTFTSSSAAGTAAAAAYAYQYTPLPPTALSRPLRILLHSMDGYTETSILGLSYLMYARRCNLPEAYLELQIERNRSFFVCPSDMGVLRRVESTLGSVDSERKREEKLARREKERAAHAHQQAASQSTFRVNDNAVVASNASAPDSASRWGKWSGSWRSGTVGGLGLGPVFGSFSATSGASTNDSGVAAGSSSSAVEPSSLTSMMMSSSTFDVNGNSSQSLMAAPLPKNFPPVQRARALTSPVSLPSHMDHSAWFMDPRFDGSFPSRVLPHLYLGNLNHATNAYMLHALGITHVVSVGECALVPPVCPVPRPGSNGIVEPGTQISLSDGNGSFVYGNGPNGQGSLWIEEREGRIKVLDIKGVSDDGIDSLRPQFNPICDWIEKAHQEGGKVLVHCRVGVSRSATVTIAYVMKYHHLSLVDAYLLVRSRRLSILIQPNMRLLYNLVGWEIELAKEQAARESLDKVPANGRLSWPCLASEVHHLNERYLS